MESSGLDPKKILDGLDLKKVAEKLHMDVDTASKMDPKKIAEKLFDADKAQPVLKTTRDWLLMIGAALYVLSPLDLIPEAVFGVFGLVDDAIVMVLAALWYLSKYNAAKNFTNKFKMG